MEELNFLFMSQFVPEIINVEIKKGAKKGHERKVGIIFKKFFPKQNVNWIVVEFVFELSSDKSKIQPFVLQENFR